MSVPTASVAVRFFAILAGVGLLTGGCKEREPIREGKETKPQYEIPYSEPEHTEKYAILGGIAPAGNGSEWWFFKLSGPAPLVREQRANFEAFIKSLQFDPLGEVDWQWKVPPGWRETITMPGLGRMATFRPDQRIETFFAPASVTIGTAAGVELVNRVEDNYGLSFVEMAVSLARGSLLDNVNRWRTQIGLPNLQAGELNRYMRPVPVENAVVFVVEMAGPTLKGPPRKGMMPSPH